MSISRVAVVGAGIVGVAVAREMTRRLPDAQVTVFDKASGVAAHQSGHTSGIVDPALEAAPGTPEAKLARRGVQLLVPFVSERGIPYRESGQLLVAQNTDEADRLEEILAHAEANKIPGVRLLDRKEMREIEPNARGALALYSPHTAVTDFIALTQALASDVAAAGGTFRFGTEITGFDVMSNEVRVRMRTAAPETHDASTGETDGATSKREDLAGTPADAAGETEDPAGTPDDAVGEREDATGRRSENSSTHSDAGLDDQVHDAPRTYRGESSTGPVNDFREELRNRFGGQDWFKQIEDTIGQLSDRFSNPASGRGPFSTGNDGWHSGRDNRTKMGEGAPRKTEDDDPRKTGEDEPKHPSEGGRRSQFPRSGRAARDEDSASFDLVIVCAGLQADRLAVAAGFGDEPRIVPFTSDYYVVDASAEVVRGIVSTVPDPNSPFSERSVVSGVNDALTLGPNTFVSLGRERYDKHGFDLGDVGSTVGFKGFWKFAAQTAKPAARGAKSAVSISAFVAEVQKFVPAISASAVKPGPRGVRAQAMDAEGKLVDELRVNTRGRLTMVRSLPRSGATSALAVAEHIADTVLEAPSGSSR